jgi:hypothetical protein
MSSVRELDEPAPPEQPRSDRDPWPWSKFLRYYRIRAGWDYENKPQEAAFIDVMIRTLWDARQYRLGRPAPEIDLGTLRDEAEALRQRLLAEHQDPSTAVRMLIDETVDSHKELLLNRARRDAGIPQSAAEFRAYTQLKTGFSRNLYRLELLAQSRSTASLFAFAWPEAAQ